MNWLTKDKKKRDRFFIYYTLIFIVIVIYPALTPTSGKDLKELVHSKIVGIEISGSDQLGMEGNNIIYNLSGKDTIQKFMSLLLRSKINNEDVNPKCNWDSKISIIYFDKSEIELWLLRSFTSGYVFSYKESYYTNDSLASIIKRKFLDSKCD